MLLTQDLGDDKIYSIPLRWGGIPFVPGSGWNLIFTVKADVDDSDVLSKIQKQTGAGITHSSSNALVAIVPTNTTGGTFTPVGAGSPVTVPALTAGTYYWDVQAQNLTTNEVRTVARGKLALGRDITRGTVTSVPMYVSPAPAPVQGPSAYQVALANGFVGSGEEWLASLVGPAGPSETTTSILAKLDGAANVANKIGSEYLPDALSGAGDPNILTITGITSPGGVNPLSLTLQGHQFTGDAVVRPSWGGVGTWGVIGGSPGGWEIFGGGGYHATHPSLAQTPIGLTGWTLLAGNGQPVFSGNNKVASHIGQLYRNTLTGVWYRWDGSAWQEDVGAKWYAATVTAAAPGDFQTSTVPTSAWWDHVVVCAYDVSLPFDASEYEGKKFMLRTEAAIGISNAKANDYYLTVIPAAPNYGVTHTLIESIGGRWMATLNYSGVPAGGSASAFNIDGGSPSSNYTSIPAINGGTP